MLPIWISALILTAITLAMHTTGIAVLVWGLARLHPVPPTTIVRVTRLLIHIMWWLILLHAAEIAVWGAFYHWRGFFPNAEAAFYFSGSSYTTVGYGDLVLPKPWRMLGAYEALLGILMCGLSTGYFFVVVSRIHQTQLEKADAARVADDLL